MNTTEGKLYFVSMADTTNRLDIQFVPPKLTISRKPDIQEIAIVGRNNPLHQYSSGSTELSFELDFHAEDENREDVIAKCRWLESMTYNEGYENPPSQVKLVYGKLFRSEVWVVKKVDYDLTLFHKQKGFLPTQAYVKIVLGLDPKTNIKSSDLR